MDSSELDLLLSQEENNKLEFKSAKYSFNEDKELPDYCAALANERGGKLILGVDNQRNIVGTKTFSGTLSSLPNELFNKLKIRIQVEEVSHSKGRVLVFSVPSRPMGQMIKSTGRYKYPMRVGESLAEMDPPTIKTILNEAELDFTSKSVEALNISGLDQQAIRKLKTLCSEKSRRNEFEDLPDSQFLQNLSLLVDEKPTYAALILVGRKEQIDKFLPSAEIIFEWRQNSKAIPHDYRESWREPFVNVFDKVWETINARNTRMPFQEGFVQREIWAFDEKSMREAILNAVTHRDYTQNGRSIFVKASPEEFVVESPGGLVPPVTVDNILIKTAWRNRRLAETFEKAGLVERSGQGMDDIFEKTIKDGKGAPDLGESDESTVRLKIPAKVKDKNFIMYLEKVANEKQIRLSPLEIYELEHIRTMQQVRNTQYKGKLLQLGIIENTGKGRGSKYILSHKYYNYTKRPGVYTRLVGITREEKKLLILKHLSRQKGFMRDFQDVFPGLSKKDINNLLQELKRDSKINFVGPRKSGYWKSVK